jgi:AAHS family 3-hydroxyphenylpropionic acid transporter
MTATVETPAVRTAAGAAVIIALCFAIAALEGYDIQSMGVAAKQIVHTLALNPTQTGWALSASMIGLVIGAVIGGRLADRIGRKPILVTSVIAFGVFSIATVFSHDFLTLMLARIACGLGLGGAMPNLIAVASEISHKDRRTITTTMMFCGMPVGGACVSEYARHVVQTDWKMIFLVGGLLPLVLAPLVIFLFKETKAAPQPHVEVDKGLLSTLFGEGRAITTLLLWVTFALTLVILYLLLQWLPVLSEAKGLSNADSIKTSLVYNLASIVGSLALGLAVDKLGLRWPMLVVYAGLAVSMLLLANATGLGPILTYVGIAGFFVVGGQYCLYGAAPMFYPSASRATGAGAAVAFGRLGSIAGPLIAGYLRAAHFSAGQVIGLMGPVALVAGLAAMTLTFTGKVRED